MDIFAEARQFRRRKPGGPIRGCIWSIHRSCRQETGAGKFHFVIAPAGPKGGISLGEMRIVPAP
jgi:hypothetical protein